MSTTDVTFELPDGEQLQVGVRQLFNAGYAGRNQEAVQAHIDELAELGVPGPSVTPAMYPVSPYLAQQCTEVAVQHDRTSGEAEWALIAAQGSYYLTVACDHTDRELEKNGVAWSKNASPDVVGRQAWPLEQIEDHLDEITLQAWVAQDGQRTQIQDSTLGELLPPRYWIEELSRRGLMTDGTIVLSGTPVMLAGVDQFAERWEVVMSDGRLDRSIGVDYTVVRMPDPIG
ncbi:DUF2848 domain-containing protein [Citricoccus sp. GCM10030269]|uniref:DUF2848 domain-containing protein n=1 Tax=Citricoccus sp. GCM10030269 TaxID=3273388 RepID=UPI0036155755